MKIIGFSGIDGSGKTTQITKIQNELSKMNKSSIIYKHRFRQPYENFVYRSNLDECIELAMDYNEQFCHFKQACDGRYDYILCDRTIVCYLVKAITEFNLNEDQVIKVFNIVSKNVIPDCTILFDISMDIAYERIQMRIEKPPESNETIAKLTQYKRAYDNILHLNFVPNVHIVSGSETMNVVTMQIIKIVTQFN